MFYLMIILLTQVLGQETWRYFSDRSEQEFTTKDSIHLDYFGQQAAEWCFSSSCSLKNKSASSALLQCSQPGFHAVSPIRNKNMSRYIRVVHSPFCYDWYLVHHKINNNKSVDGFRVWIVDPLHSSIEEKQLTALLPSSFSAKLSTIFYKFGQQPFLALKSGYRLISSSVGVTTKGFTQNSSYWDFITTEPISNSQEVVWITGKSIAYHDCFIRDKQVQLLKTKYDFPFDSQEPRVQLVGGSQESRVIKDPCSPYIAAFISSGFLLTQDNFRSTSHLYIPTSLLQGTEPVVEDLSFLPNGNLVVLLKPGKLFVYNKVTGVFTKATGITNGLVSRLARTMAAYSDCPSTEKNLNFNMIAWSNVEGVAKVFSSSDGGYTLNELNISSSWYIHEVVYHQFYQSFFFLASNLIDSKKQPSVLEYLSEVQSWREHRVAFTNLTEGRLSFTFLPQNSHFMLVWNAQTIFYGGLSEKDTFLQLKTRDGIDPFEAGAATNISTICTGWSGEFIVVLEDGRMFYGRNDVSYMVEIFGGEPPSSQISVMFDLTGRLILIANSSDSFARRYFPLRNEITSAVFPDTACPYLRFSTNIPPKLQYIDKGENKSFWVSLIYHRSSDNAIVHRLSSTTLLDVTINEELEYYPGMVMINKTFTFGKTKKSNSYSQTSTFGTGAMWVLFHPKTAGLTCKDTSEKELLIKVGCRPSRHIRIRNCTDPPKTGNSTQIDYSNYHGVVQCEFLSRVGKNIVLGLDLYDGDHKVSEVLNDYVLWEETNKQGYSYTATMEQAGCVKEAQSWNNMNNSWNQNNYESCFERSGAATQFDGKQLYQILNSTGTSRVTFTDDGKFAFTLKVIDPNLSFCTLKGRFMVVVQPGMGDREFMPEIISMCVVIVTSLGYLCASFWLYRRETMSEHEQDRQTAERLQQLRSIYKGVRMSVDCTRQSTSGLRHSIRRSSGTAALLVGLDNKKSSQEGKLMVPVIQEGDECED